MLKPREGKHLVWGHTARKQETWKEAQTPRLLSSKNCSLEPWVLICLGGELSVGSCPSIRLPAVWDHSPESERRAGWSRERVSDAASGADDVCGACGVCLVCRPQRVPWGTLPCRHSGTPDPPWEADSSSAGCTQSLPSFPSIRPGA